MRVPIQLVMHDGVRLGMDVSDIRYFHEIKAEETTLTRIATHSGELFDVTLGFDALYSVVANHAVPNEG